MTTPPLRVVEEGYGERNNLNASPQVPLEFNYPVRLADAANGVWFQDRISRERFPAEILLNVAEGKMDDAPVVEAKETTRRDNRFSCPAASTTARRSSLRPGRGWYLRRLWRALVTVSAGFSDRRNPLSADRLRGRAQFPSRNSPG